MKSISVLYLWVFALIIFLFLGYMINLDIEDKKSKYCKNAVLLISSSDSLNNKVINPNWTPVELDSFFENKIIVNQCDRNFFGIPHILHNSNDREEEIVITGFVEKECPNPNITSCGFLSDIPLYVQKDTIYEGLHTILPNDSLLKYIRYWKNFADSFSGIENKSVRIVLDDDIFNYRTVNKIIESAIIAHLDYVNSKSLKLFNKNLCDLKRKEVLEFKSKFPFELEIMFGRDFYIPPKDE